uniref:Conopeptide n=1 Tax=Conus lenavati TaxID=1519839 RepID=A0A0K8TUA7_CONLV
MMWKLGVVLLIFLVLLPLTAPRQDGDGMAYTGRHVLHRMKNALKITKRDCGERDEPCCVNSSGAKYCEEPWECIHTSLLCEEN